MMETANSLPDNHSAEFDLQTRELGISPDEAVAQVHSDECRNRWLTEKVNEVLAGEGTSQDVVLHRMQLTSIQAEE